MIQVGTKLKSVRSGEVVEVIELRSGEKKVRKADGTEKILSDCNIARWYDEVSDSPEAPKPVKAVKTAPVKEKKVEQAPEVKKEKKAAKKEISAEVLMGSKLADAFKQAVVANKWEMYCVKKYSGVKANNKYVCHFHLLRKKIKFQFKPSDLTSEEMKWLLKFPDHFRRAYCYYTYVSDEAALNKVLEVISRIAKQEKK